MKRMKLLLFVLILPSILLAQDEKGTVDVVEVTCPALEGNLIGDPATKTIFVYLPPNYETSDKQYPVYYWVTGYTWDLTSSTYKRYFVTTSEPDRMARDGEIREMINVSLDGHNRFDGSYYFDSVTTGNWETYVAEDVVDYVDSHYRTIPHRDSRGISGHSMGGFGAMHIALSRPDVFGAVLAESGLYDLSTDFGKGKQTWDAGASALADPQNWDEMDALDWEVKEWFAMAAAFVPNPDKPPFFLDKPHELVDGEPRVVTEVQERMIARDVIRDVDRYLNQPVRLNHIKFRHGRADNLVPVEQARILSNRLTELGIEHEYEEHGGGHMPTTRPFLIFFSEKLSFEMPTNVSATTWGSVKAQMK